jgi:hypothetical protein
MSGLDARQPTDADWLALCLVTESNRPAEWPAIAQVIENRRRSGRWGKTYRDVILARMQFSAFNSRTAGKITDYSLVFELMADHERPLLLMHAAAMAHRGPLDDAGWDNRITLATMHYYSPVSMRPAGSRPAWAKAAKRLYTPPGVDPERFVFAESVQ